MSEHDGNEGAAHDECVIDPTDEGETQWNPFDEFHEEVDLGIVPKVMAKDGMPTNFAPYDDDKSDIPPLSPETCVCMGVFTEFVVRDEWGNVIAKVPGDVVERTPSGRFRVKRGRFIQYNPDPRPKGVIRSWLEKHFSGEWVEVEPIRPICKHYVRQLSPYYLNPKHKKAFRLCAARRTTEGTFMDLSDMGMFACDMRDPPHLESKHQLDAFDERKMREGRERKYLPMFAGFEPKDENPGPGGIFNG
jgi:hypothetical protein